MNYVLSFTANCNIRSILFKGVKKFKSHVIYTGPLTSGACATKLIGTAIANDLLNMTVSLCHVALKAEAYSLSRMNRNYFNDKISHFF